MASIDNFRIFSCLASYIQHELPINLHFHHLMDRPQILQPPKVEVASECVCGYYLVLPSKTWGFASFHGLLEVILFCHGSSFRLRILRFHFIFFRMTIRRRRILQMIMRIIVVIHSLPCIYLWYSQIYDHDNILQ